MRQIFLVGGMGRERVDMGLWEWVRSDFFLEEGGVGWMWGCESGFGQADLGRSFEEASPELESNTIQSQAHSTHLTMAMMRGKNCGQGMWGPQLLRIKGFLCLSYYHICLGTSDSDPSTSATRFASGVILLMWSNFLVHHIHNISLL